MVQRMGALMGAGGEVGAGAHSVDFAGDAGLGEVELAGAGEGAGGDFHRGGGGLRIGAGEILGGVGHAVAIAIAIVVGVGIGDGVSAFTQQARFTADAAHELRTPVTAALTDEQREAFDACQRAS